MAVAVSPDLAFFTGAAGTSSCDTASTDWASDGTISTVTDFMVQGLGSIGVKLSTSANVTTKFTIAATVNLTGKIVVAWVANLEVKKLETITNGGVRILIEDLAGVIRTWYVAGKDTWHGGWTPFVVHAEKVPEPGLGSDSGTGFDVTQVKKVGIGFKHGAFLIKVNPNGHFDAVRYGTGLTVKGETLVGTNTTYRARSNGVATLTTATVHGLSVGSSVRVRAMTDASYNGAINVDTVPTTTTFTYANTGSNEGSTADTAGRVATPATFQHLIDAEVANTTPGVDFGPNWGIINKDRGVIFSQGNITIGSTVNAANEETYFRDVDQLVVFPNRPVIINYYELKLQGSAHASSPTDIYFGDPVTGVGGLVIKAESLVSRFKITATDTNITKFGFYGCNFLNAGLISGQAYNANKQFSKCSFIQCSRFVPSTGIVGGCNFIGTAAYEEVIGAIAHDYATATTVMTSERTAANNDTTNDMTLLPTTPAANDAYYFGSNQRFPRLKLKQDTSGVGTWTITWEYWNGAWTALSGVIDGTSNFRPGAAGTYYVTYTMPTDWTATVVPAGAANTAYWIRARVSSYTNVTTAPKASRAWTWNRAILIDSLSHYVTNNNFINCGNAVHVGISGHVDMDNLKFTGGTYHIENSTNSAVEIDRLNGSNPDSAKLLNTGGSTMTLVDIGITLTLKCVDKDNNALNGIRCRIEKANDGTTLLNEETANVSGEDGIATESYIYPGSPVAVRIRARKSSTGGPKYIPFSSVGTIEGDFSLTIVMYQDSNVS